MYLCACCDGYGQYSVAIADAAVQTASSTEIYVLFLNFANLNEDPFRIAPDPRYLYMSKGHARAQSYIASSGFLTDGFVVITGEIGSGKSLLIHDFMSKVDPNVVAVEIHQTNINPVQFLQTFLDRLGFKAFKRKKAELISMINMFLLDNCSRGKRTVLIIDEAQKLSLDVLEEIRMLTGIESGNQRVLSVILTGQPEFREKLQLPSMKQLAQRSPLHFHLRSLNRTQTKEYVIHRLRIAGDTTNEIFDDEAFESVYMHTAGVPRLINILCGAALLCAFADEDEVITKATVASAVKELEWGEGANTEEKQLRGTQNAEAYELRIAAIKAVAREKLEQLVRKSTAQENAIARLRSEIDEKTAKVGALQDEIMQLQDEKSATTDRSAARATLEEQTASLSDTINALSAEYDAAKIAHAHLGRQFEAVNTNNAKLVEELENQKVLIEKYERDITEYRVARRPVETSASMVSTVPLSGIPSINYGMLVEIGADGSINHALGAGALGLGSSLDNDVLINSEFASPHHARIVSTATMCVIEDLGSTNGTYVNDRRIRKHALRNRDSIVIGKQKFQFFNRGTAFAENNVQGVRVQSSNNERAMAAHYKPMP